MKTLVKLCVIAALSIGAWYVIHTYKDDFASTTQRPPLSPVPAGKEAELEHIYGNVRRFIEVGDDCKQSVNALVTHLKNARQNKNIKKGLSND